MNRSVAGLLGYLESVLGLSVFVSTVSEYLERERVGFLEGDKEGEFALANLSLQDVIPETFTSAFRRVTDLKDWVLSWVLFAPALVVERLILLLELTKGGGIGGVHFADTAFSAQIWAGCVNIRNVKVPLKDTRRLRF